MNTPLTLDNEFKRVAKAEKISLEELVYEVAVLADRSTRHIYNYRSGQQSLPAEMIPLLCKRFGSRALLDELADECRETPVEVPELYELSRLVSQTIRQDLKYYERFLDAFEDGVVDAREMAQLEESGARVVQNVRQFEAIARQDFERRKAHVRR
jgi:hypothetical protein